MYYGVSLIPRPSPEYETLAKCKHYAYSIQREAVAMHLDPSGEFL